MDESSKRLEKLIKLCRKHGVLEFEGDGLKLKLNPDRSIQKSKKTKDTPEETPSQPFSDQELMFWSSGGGIS